MIPNCLCKIGPGFLPYLPSFFPRRRKQNLASYANDGLFYCLLLAQVTAHGFSQKINLSIREAPLNKVFKEIQKQSGYSFWYRPANWIKRQSDPDLKNASLDEALKKCFENQPFDYVIVEQTIVVTPRETPAPRY